MTVNLQVSIHYESGEVEQLKSYALAMGLGIDGEDSVEVLVRRLATAGAQEAINRGRFYGPVQVKSGPEGPPSWTVV